jgi:hypothetical protein
MEGLNFNLLSVSKLYVNEYHINFDSNVCHLADSFINKFLYKGKKRQECILLAF